MKKVNINLLLSLLIVLALFAVTVFCFFLSDKLDSELLETTGSSIESTLQQDEIDDVEGWGVIIQGLGYGFAFWGYLALLIIAVIVGGYALIMLLFTVVARIVFSKDKPLAYRILMGIVYAMQILLELFILTTLISQFAIVWFIAEVVFVGITVYCTINTYSSRMLQ